MLCKTLVINSIYTRKITALKSKMSSGLIDYKTYSFIKTELESFIKTLEEEIK